jgi:hypothetical protein
MFTRWALRDAILRGLGNYGRRFWHYPLARVSYGNDICSSTMLGLLTFFGVFFSSPRMMTIVASRNGWIPSHWPWPLSGLHQLPTWHHHLQPEAAPGRSTCFPRSSGWQPVLPLCNLHLWMPREDERLVPSFITSTTGVLYVVSIVLRRRLLALRPVLVQLDYECNPVSKFPKAC